jgi:four helix bundle protein
MRGGDKQKTVVRKQKLEGIMGEIKSYRDLLVWQKSMDLVMACYDATALFPPSERFGLVSTIQRAVTLVPSNIANGQGIAITGQFLQQLKQAHGSLMVVETQILVAERLGYLPAETVQAILAMSGEVGKMLNGLMRSLGSH